MRRLARAVAGTVSECNYATRRLTELTRTGADPYAEFLYRRDAEERGGCGPDGRHICR